MSDKPFEDDMFYFDPNEDESMGLDRQVGVWLPLPSYDKYKIIQQRSKRRFIKWLRKKVIREIDAVYAKIDVKTG